MSLSKTIVRAFKDCGGELTALGVALGGGCLYGHWLIAARPEPLLINAIPLVFFAMGGLGVALRIKDKLLKPSVC